MYIIKIHCADHVGAAARITTALREVNVSTRNIYFTTREERYGFFRLRSRTAGEGEIVIKDEDWDLVSWQLRELARKRKNLDLKISAPHYRVTLLIADKSGALDDELEKLAKERINIREIKSFEPTANGKVFVRLVFECSPEKYDLAKRLLSHCLQNESPFLVPSCR